jgi:DpnII restriction endonuclease
LLRCLLPIYFEDIRPESRTPSYDPGTRTDFRLKPHGIALTVKRTSSRHHEKELGEQLQEDVNYYERESGCKILVAFIHDPERLLREPETLEAMWSKPQESFELRCVIAG